MEKRKNQKVLVFDCDGTVLDTFELIKEVTLETFKIVDPSYPITVDEAASFFGPFVDETFTKYADPSTKKYHDFLNTYNELIALRTKDYVTVYPGLKEVLKTLKEEGCILGIASNKLSKEVARGLALTKIDGYFDFIKGAEIMEEVKPAPWVLNQIKKEYPESDIYMIGDASSDILCGKRANVATIACTWRRVYLEDFAKLEPDYIIDEPKELLEIIL